LFCNFSGRKKSSFPRKFIYTGRFHKRKGVDLLIRAFLEISEGQDHDWELILIGNGPEKEKLVNLSSGCKSIHFYDFMDHVTLAGYMKDAGVFVLPSRFEAWAVVIHEFVAAGFPIICSDECGAATEFLKHGINGFEFKTGDKASLKQMMLKVMALEDGKLWRMGEKSYEFSKHIAPKIYAVNMMNILLKK